MSRPSTQSYILSPLVENIPLAPEESTEEAHITCIELAGDNLYIGTSAAEILHFVSIPSDPLDDAEPPTYIFASRLQPAYNEQASSPPRPGIQQILVLTKVQKACILCNGTLSFYTLPELSPAFGNTTVANCTFVGGLDLDTPAGQGENVAVVMICVKNKVRLVKIADEVRRIKDIQFPGCLAACRRSQFACVADTRGYALLDVDNQQKISLFPISSLDENPATGQVEDVSSLRPSHGRSSSASRPGTGQSGHGRSTSLGDFVGNISRRQGSPQPSRGEGSGLLTPEPFLEEAPGRPPSHSRSGSSPAPKMAATPSPDKTLPLPPRSDSLPQSAPFEALKPFICSPTSSEFLLVTGTSPGESGVGMFVNLDGDVVRGTIEFSQYPTSVAIDRTTSPVSPEDNSKDTAGFVLATLSRQIGGRRCQGIEIQKWDIANDSRKEWISQQDLIGSQPESDNVNETGFGLTGIETPISTVNQATGKTLRAGRLLLTAAESQDSELRASDIVRNKEEVAFGRRLGSHTSNLILWSGSSIWCVSRNMLVMKLEAALEQAVSINEQQDVVGVDRSQVIGVVSSVRGQEPTTETEFLSIEYVRQKASIILFGDMIYQPRSMTTLPSADVRITESLLMDGGIDPRITIFLITPLDTEIIEGKHGIWIYAGLTGLVSSVKQRLGNRPNLQREPELLQLIKRYLTAWRQRKGFGSIADETEVFSSVDAALLRVLLIQDSKVKPLPSRPSSERNELYSFIDSGLDCFDRAAKILEDENRLYTLSRLYQSRRLARKVLETWQRIIDGEEDADGGLVDGENEVRRYLVNVRDHAIVDEYGTWLAKRNPPVGVQVFTNESSKVNWEPHQVVMLLRRRAPNAVKDYLEHLVFGKKHVQYANDLISHYLDSVLDVLATSETAKDQLAKTYQIYRALRPPKPTYREYITENAISEPWWHDRLRLLELIGGSHGSNFAYDVQKVLSRIEPFEEDLVPESIILDGRQGRHKQALRLLTHSLGDYHTAVNYCLLGGASIFHPTQGSAQTPSHEEQAILFEHLLVEFLRIEDVSDRLEQTSELLARFSRWFDVRQVLDLIPESWSVELVSGFLVSAFRRLVHEKNEVMVMKALSGAQNLQIASEFVEKCKDMGPQLEGAKAL